MDRDIEDMLADIELEEAFQTLKDKYPKECWDSKLKCAVYRVCLQYNQPDLEVAYLMLK